MDKIDLACVRTHRVPVWRIYSYLDSFCSSSSAIATVSVDSRIPPPNELFEKLIYLKRTSFGRETIAAECETSTNRLDR